MHPKYNGRSSEKMIIEINIGNSENVNSSVCEGARIFARMSLKLWNVRFDAFVHNMSQIFL
jgi:hypothetical protein